MMITDARRSRPDNVTRATRSHPARRSHPAAPTWGRGFEAAENGAEPIEIDRFVTTAAVGGIIRRTLLPSSGKLLFGSFVAF